MSHWWMQFPRPESRTPREPRPEDRPLLAQGDLVRLRGKPDRARRVLRAEWHWHRHAFVYIVETNAPSHFEPYWFFEQMASA